MPCIRVNALSMSLYMQNAVQVCMCTPAFWASICLMKLAYTYHIIMWRADRVPKLRRKEHMHAMHASMYPCLHAWREGKRGRAKGKNTQGKEGWGGQAEEGRGRVSQRLPIHLFDGRGRGLGRCADAAFRVATKCVPKSCGAMLCWVRVRDSVSRCTDDTTQGRITPHGGGRPSVSGAAATRARGPGRPLRSRPSASFAPHSGSDTAVFAPAPPSRRDVVCGARRH